MESGPPSSSRLANPAQLPMARKLSLSSGKYTVKLADFSSAVLAGAKCPEDVLATSAAAPAAPASPSTASHFHPPEVGTCQEDLLRNVGTKRHVQDGQADQGPLECMSTCLPSWSSMLERPASAGAAGVTLQPGGRGRLVAGHDVVCAADGGAAVSI